MHRVVRWYDLLEGLVAFVVTIKQFFYFAFHRLVPSINRLLNPTSWDDFEKIFVEVRYMVDTILERQSYNYKNIKEETLKQRSQTTETK